MILRLKLMMTSRTAIRMNLIVCPGCSFLLLLSSVIEVSFLKKRDGPAHLRARFGPGSYLYPVFLNIVS